MAVVMRVGGAGRDRPESHTRQLLRARPNPLIWAKCLQLRGAHPAGPPPVPEWSPITVQRRANSFGVIMVTRQTVSLGRLYVGRVVTVHVSDSTLTIDLDDGPRNVHRTTDLPVRNVKAHRPRQVGHVSEHGRQVAHDLAAALNSLDTWPSEHMCQGGQARMTASSGSCSAIRMSWTAAQLRAFLETASDHRLFAFFRLAAYTGARRGELLNLRWRDVDLDTPQIHIGKGKDTYVFTTGWGEPVFPDTLSSLMPKLIEAHNKKTPGLPHARLHDLRHIPATTLLLAGVPVHVVAARLGHADPAITLRVYAHVIHEQAATAADVFADAVMNAA
ncbi:site-specific integrase [Nonomuraea dietziae]|uniref:site-specific integrase n=1 Tax=Nonomuraea dietziae TaxID=65515 RepID=UPI0033DB4422